MTCMFSFPGGFVSGHKDGTIKVWSNAFECRDTFDLTTATPASMNASVRSVCVNHDASVVLVGTQGCEIYELALASKRFTLRVEGHYENEVGAPGLRVCVEGGLPPCAPPSWGGGGGARVSLPTSLSPPAPFPCT